MAGEFTGSITLRSTIGLEQSETVNITGNQTGKTTSRVLQTIATSAQAVDLGAVSLAAASGRVFIKNLDTTNYVEVSYDDATSVGVNKVLAGEAILLMPAAGTTLYAKANTAVVDILVKAFPL